MLPAVQKLKTAPDGGMRWPRPEAVNAGPEGTEMGSWGWLLRHWREQWPGPASWPGVRMKGQGAGWEGGLGGEKAQEDSREGATCSALSRRQCLELGSHECCCEEDVSDSAAVGTWTLAKLQQVVRPRES